MYDEQKLAAFLAAKAKPSAHAIVVAIAAEWQIPVQDIFAHSRRQRAASARYQLIYTLRHQHKWTLQKIGNYLGRHHTSILYGLRKHAAFLKWKAAHHPTPAATDSDAEFYKRRAALRARANALGEPAYDHYNAGRVLLPSDERMLPPQQVYNPADLEHYGQKRAHWRQKNPERARVYVMRDMARQQARATGENLLDLYRRWGCELPIDADLGKQAKESKSQ